jgi:DNA-binding SARP family transcriptional activator
MLRLRTLGGLSLVRGEAPLTGAITQRRRLAILALLAVARDRGMSREKLVAYLWPESDEERGRHVLNQLLYAQRREAGTPSLFVGKKTLRLEPSLIATDVAEFESAVEAGDLEAAVASYGGVFLDGFHLKDAPEFEQWADGQRLRLSRLYASALVALAARASAAGDTPVAVRWWQHAAQHDPLDFQTARGMVEALITAGDRPAAAMAARRYEEMVRAELGVEPDPGLSNLLTRPG